MCLGVPGRIIERWQADDGALLARADFVGEVRVIRLNEAAADKTIALMRGVGLLGGAPERPAQLVTGRGSP